MKLAHTSSLITFPNMSATSEIIQICILNIISPRVQICVVTRTLSIHPVQASYQLIKELLKFWLSSVHMCVKIEIVVSLLCNRR